MSDNRMHSKFLSESDREEWKFIKAIAQNDQEEMFRVLELNKNAIIKKTEGYTGKKHQSGPSSSKKKTADLGFLRMSEVEAEDFFTSLG
mmetsp:Transcript_32759/g.29632  ORF Transcript_32759/g.29632 Transcript_32759/m.29632 type:complete len:89 (+) Transcript_32759:754-1020(+)